MHMYTNHMPNNRAKVQKEVQFNPFLLKIVLCTYDKINFLLHMIESPLHKVIFLDIGFTLLFFCESSWQNFWFRYRIRLLKNRQAQLSTTCGLLREKGGPIFFWLMIKYSFVAFGCQMRTFFVSLIGYLFFCAR